MMESIRAGKLDVEIRRRDDVERLLRSPRYWAGRIALKALFYPVDKVWGWTRLQGLRRGTYPVRSLRRSG